MPDNITVTFDRASLKIWFVYSYCRNIDNVLAMERCGNAIKVYIESGRVFIINWDNITFIEEVESKNELS